MVIKLGSMVTYPKELLSVKSHNPLCFSTSWDKLKTYISTAKMSMATKLETVVTYHEVFSSHKFKWPFDHMVLQDHVINNSNYISTNKLPKASKFGRMVNSIEQLSPIKLTIPLVTWSRKITWQNKAIWCLWSYCWIIFRSCYQYRNMRHLVKFSQILWK